MISTGENEVCSPSTTKTNVFLLSEKALSLANGK